MSSKISKKISVRKITSSQMMFSSINWTQCQYAFNNELIQETDALFLLPLTDGRFRLFMIITIYYLTFIMIIVVIHALDCS